MLDGFGAGVAHECERGGALHSCRQGKGDGRTHGPCGRCGRNRESGHAKAGEACTLTARQIYPSLSALSAAVDGMDCDHRPTQSVQPVAIALHVTVIHCRGVCAYAYAVHMRSAGSLGSSWILHGRLLLHSVQCGVRCAT
eukprot:scaffold23450_cov135-Isochrysis_galbana.AAC.3